MEIKIADITLTLILNMIHIAFSQHILSCNGSMPEPCPGDHQICVVNTHQCVCMSGYTMISDECVTSSDHSSSHSATAAVVSIFTLALLGGGLALVIRKYNLIEYIRQKINLRRSNDVMYEDVMIGQDDPPLSP